jgi:hypothetical protein
MRRLLLKHQTNRSLLNLCRIPAHSSHGSILSRFGASGKFGAVQFVGAKMLTDVHKAPIAAAASATHRFVNARQVSQVESSCADSIDAAGTPSSRFTMAMKTPVSTRFSASESAATTIIGPPMP